MSSRSNLKTCRLKPSKPLREFVEVHPRGEVLHTTQNRLREKTFLSQNGFPVTPFRHIKTARRFIKRRRRNRRSVRFENRRFRLRRQRSGENKIRRRNRKRRLKILKNQEAVLEAFVEFEKEVSVVAARDRKGNFAHYGVIENAHENHILDVSFAPALVSEKIYREAVEIARERCRNFRLRRHFVRRIFSDAKTKNFLINELAPRPHNSGHLTFDACVDVAVRTAIARRLRFAARLDRILCDRRRWQICWAICGRAASRIGQTRLKFPEFKASSLRQSRSAARAQNGTSDGARARGAGSRRDGAKGERKFRSKR